MSGGANTSMSAGRDRVSTRSSTVANTCHHDALEAAVHTPAAHQPGQIAGEGRDTRCDESIVSHILAIQEKLEATMKIVESYLHGVCKYSNTG